MNEYDAHDPAADAHSWQQHDWTGEEAQFAAQYLQHGDAARAWFTAYEKGFDGRSRMVRHRAVLKGEALLAEPFMRDYIAYIRDKIKARLEVSTDRILEELAALAYSNMTDFVVIQDDGTAVTDLSGLTREQLAAVQEITVDTYMEGRGDDAVPVKSVKVKLVPKIGALELLGKHKKMWTDVLEHNDLTDIGDVMTKRRQQRRKRQDQGEDEDGQPSE